jgi:hypothetical protein
MLEETVVRSGDLPLDWSISGPTPIFDRMASRWFAGTDATNGEWAPAAIDEARLVAETAMEPMAAAEPSRSGLPTRVPGAQLAPGTAQTREPGKQDNGFRDPNAIRENLSRHYHGMRAARRATNNGHNGNNGAAPES